MGTASDPVITALGTINTAGTAYVAAALTAAVAIAGGFWGISMLKKAMNAAK